MEADATSRLHLARRKCSKPDGTTFEGERPDTQLHSVKAEGHFVALALLGRESGNPLAPGASGGSREGGVIMPLFRRTTLQDLAAMVALPPAGITRAEAAPIMQRVRPSAQIGPGLPPGTTSTARWAGG